MTEPIGEVVLYKVLLGLATNYGERTFEIFDCHSQDLLEVYEALFDLDTDDIKDEIDGQFACLGSGLLIIDRIRLEPQWRGLKLGLLALRKLIDIHQSDCRLVVCQPYRWKTPTRPRRVGPARSRCGAASKKNTVSGELDGRTSTAHRPRTSCRSSKMCCSLRLLSEHNKRGAHSPLVILRR